MDDDMPLEPFCCACGVLLPFPDELFPPEPELERGGFSKKEKERAAQLFWTAHHRVIIKREQHLPHEQRYHLSGISQFGYDHHLISRDRFKDMEQVDEIIFCVPWDRHEVVIDYRDMRIESRTRQAKFEDRRSGIYPANFWDNRNQNLYPHGFPVHSRCWSLIERIIGPSAKRELDLFVWILYQRWQEQPFEVSNCIDGRFWTVTEDIWLEFDEQYIETKPPPEALVALTDPIDILEIKDIISRAIEKPANGGEKKHPGSRNEGTVRNNKGIAGHQALVDLPLDVQFLLLDRLRPADARKTLTATRWQVPDSYWRCRSPRDIVFEIDELDPTVKVDWALFCQETEELLESKSSYGLLNRQRLFRILAGTRDMFFSALGDRDLKN